MDSDNLVEALRAAVIIAKKYFAIFSNSPVFIAVLDRNGKFLEANPSLIESVGKDIVGKTLHEVFPKEVADIRLGRVRRVVESGEPFQVQEERDYRYFTTHYHPLKLFNDVYCLVMAVEITEIVRVQRLLQVLDRVGSATLRAGNIKELFEEVCETLFGLEEIVRVEGVILGDSVARDVSGEMRAGLGDKCGGWERCARDVRVVLQRADSSSAPYRYTFSVELERERLGHLEIHVRRKFSEKEKALLKRLVDVVALAIDRVRMRERLGDNLVRIAYLVDRIRKPLTVVQLLAEVEMDDSVGSILREQVRRIEESIATLDDAWRSSEEILKVLRF